MDIKATALPDVKVITPARYGDHRGFFCEVYDRRALAEAAIDIEFVQDNHSYSAQRGTLRGLHFQRPPAARTKLLRVRRGAVVDVAVDCRQGSPTFGEHVMVELSAAAGNQILCPKGFAHATLTMAPDTEITYEVDAYYAPPTATSACASTTPIARSPGRSPATSWCCRTRTGTCPGSATCRRCSPIADRSAREEALVHERRRCGR